MTESDDLVARVTEFSERLIDTVNGVLPGENGFVVDVGPEAGRERNVTINQLDPKGIQLTVDGVPMYRLEVSFRCMWNSNQHFFAVNESTFKISVEGVNEPILHFDYGRDFEKSLPVAHVNVHAHRDELMYGFMAAHRKRGKARAKAMERGHIPRLSDLHIPLGGHRFRPSIEDVLEMLINEFGVDTRDGYLEVLHAGRATFRSIQISAAVSDDPEVAADALRREGYTVTAPDPVPEAKPHRLIRF